MDFRGVFRDIFGKDGGMQDGLPLARAVEKPEIKKPKIKELAAGESLEERKRKELEVLQKEFSDQMEKTVREIDQRIAKTMGVSSLIEIFEESGRNLPDSLKKFSYFGIDGVLKVATLLDEDTGNVTDPTVEAESSKLYFSKYENDKKKSVIHFLLDSTLGLEMFVSTSRGGIY